MTFFYYVFGVLTFYYGVLIYDFFYDFGGVIFYCVLTFFYDDDQIL